MSVGWKQLAAASMLPTRTLRTRLVCWRRGPFRRRAGRAAVPARCLRRRARLARRTVVSRSRVATEAHHLDLRAASATTAFATAVDPATLVGMNARAWI